MIEQLEIDKEEENVKNYQKHRNTMIKDKLNNFYNNTIMNNDKKINLNLVKLSLKTQQFNKLLKKLMPGIHEKTHFKSATTLGFMLPSSLYTHKDAENEWHPKKKKD